MLGLDLSPTGCAVRRAPLSPVAPVITAAGSGYAGALYSADRPGQWYADDLPIPGATGSSWIMTLAQEGAVIRCGASNAIQMWTPSLLPGVAAILDIRQGLTLSGSNVTAWQSQTGSITGTQSTASAQPVYSATGLDGAPALLFEGRNDLGGIALATAPPERSLICALLFSGASLRAVIGASSAGGYTFRADAGHHLQIISTNVLSRATATGALTAEAPAIVGARCVASGAYEFRAGGVSLGSGVMGGGFSGSGTLHLGNTPIGGASRMRGAISSLVICEAYLTEDDIQRSEGWIAHTLGRSDLLAATHPYKTTAPRVI